MQATFTLSDKTAKISTDEGTSEFRPARLSWKNALEFSVSGLGPKAKLRRLTLRFRTPHDAQLAASAVESVIHSRNETFQIDEIPVQVQYPIPKRLGITVAKFVAWVTFLPTIMSVYFILEGSLAAGFGLLLVIMMFYFFPVWIVKKYARKGVTRPYQAWLRTIGDEISLRTAWGNSLLFPSRVEKIIWTGSERFVLASRHEETTLIFMNSDDAARAAAMIKSMNAGVTRENRQG